MSQLNLGIDQAPMAWLGRFQKALQTLRAAEKPEQGQERRVSDQQNEVMRMILTALLDHPLPEVQAAAAESCADAVLAIPLIGISLLPLLLHKLQLSVAISQQGAMTQAQQSQHAGVLMALLRAIPCMAMHQTALPFVQRALMPFSQPGAPELVLALGLKLHTQLWMTTGRGFNSLLGGLSGFPHAHPHAGDMLRTVRGACLRDVCRHDSSRGVELVRAIQECVEDPYEAVAALGLQAIALLCEDDVLEFYAAWRVVHRAFPKVPSQELVAVQWVGMLKHGVLDADANPDKAAVIIDMLWTSTVHPSPQVRAAAYQTLAAYPMDLLETLQALRPGHHYVQLLTAERDSRGRAECEALVGKALSHEHMRRRRYIGGSSKPAGVRGTPHQGEDPASPEFQLTQALPKLLLQQAEQAGRRSSAGVILLLWGPPPPSQHPLPGSEKALAAQQAASAYLHTFHQVLEMPCALGSSQHALALHTWGRFLARWLAAAKASQGRAKGAQGGLVQAGDNLWAVIKGAIDSSSPGAAENAAVAAAALAGVLPPGSHGLVTDVVQKLRAGMGSRSAALVKACTLALGPASAHLHPTDAQTRQEVVDRLLTLMASHSSTSLRAVCAESLGLFVASSTESKTLSGADAQAAAVRIAEGLLRMLCTLCSAAVAPVGKLVQSVPDLLHKDCLAGVQSGLAHTAVGMPASAAASFADALLHMAQAVTNGIMHKHSAAGSGDRQQQAGASLAGLTAAEDALLAGCCLVQAAACHHLAAEQQQQQYQPTSEPHLLQQQQQQQQFQPTSEPHHQQQQQQQQQAERASSAAAAAVLLRTALSQLRGILAASKHGKLTGTAASSLGSVINSALTAQLSETRAPPSTAAAAGQSTQASAQHAQHGVSVDLNDSDLKGGFSDLLAAGEQVGKLPGAALGKQGVARGLSTLLGGCVGPHGNPAGSALLGRSGWSKETDLALQALVQMSLHDTNPRVATAASWGLAAACHACRHRNSASTAVAGTNTAVAAQMRGLAGLPEDGAMTSLVQIVLTGQNHVLQTSVTTMAAVMRCLAHAPRLPPLDWGSPCQRLLNLAASTQAAEHPDSISEQEAADSADTTADSTSDLGTACLLLTLKHGGVASLGLGGLLDQLMTQHWFSQLPAQLQQMLLTGLPEVLQALSSHRSAAVLSTLSTLSTLSLSSNRQHAGQLSVAAWTGLARLMHSVQDSNSHSSTAAPAGAVGEEAHRAVAQMLQQLPLPPFLLPGEALPEPSMQLDDALHSTNAAGGMHSSLEQRTATQREEDRTELEVWGAACACLQKMPAQQVAESLSADKTEWAVQAAFAQAVMVQRNKLPFEHLKAARRLCISLRLEGLPAVMSALGAAVQQPSLQHSVLLETLDAVQVADVPEQAMQLVGLLTAHWHAQPQAQVGWPVQLVTALSPALAVQSLPYTLPALLQRQAWLQAAEPVTRRLIRLVGASEAQQQRTHDRNPGAGQLEDQRSQDLYARDQGIADVAAACLVAVREHLAEDAWQSMPHVLACMRQHSRP
ncbi:hypothetical protein ABBQ38_003780 [Trebouxia sp. C0009 RCD-2024]